MTHNKPPVSCIPMAMIALRLLAEIIVENNEIDLTLSLPEACMLHTSQLLKQFMGVIFMSNLPFCDSTHDQERRSILAFQNILPDRLFLLRNEDGVDYGTDRILELKIGGRQASNFRIHVQIKSIRSAQRSSDGTLNYQVSIKTLNYLLNQPSSLFVIYLENENIFLWEWANVINNWARQKNILIAITEQETLNSVGGL